MVRGLSRIVGEHIYPKMCIRGIFFMSLWMMGGVTSSWRYARPLAEPSAIISLRRQFIREPPRPITSLQKSEYVSNAFRYVYVDRLINQYT